MGRQVYRKFLIITLVVSLLLLGIENIGALTGHVTEGSTSSNVAVIQSLAISFSSQLSDGIIFEDIRFLPVTNVNASHNYDGVDNSTQYFILVSTDGNTAVDVCLKASGPLTTVNGDSIPLIGETYSTSQISNVTSPLLNEEVSLTTEYVLSEEDIPLGGAGYVRFFLDVPSAQASGNYMNSIFFRGQPTGVPC